MTERLTDKQAVRIALSVAIDTEESLVDAYKGDETEPAVQEAKRRIAAFHRVLERYYGNRKSLAALWWDKHGPSKKVDAYSYSAKVAANKD